MHDLVPEVLLTVLAGLGLFLVGIKTLTRALKALARVQVRLAAGRIARRSALAALWGAVAGLVTQSGRTTSFLVASMVKGGLLTTQSGLLVTIWANFGCTLMVFAAVVPIHFLVLLLVGVSGIFLAMEYPRRYATLYGAVFGVALMLFGLRMIPNALESLMELQWLDEILHLVRGSAPLGFALGFVLTVLAQSHMAILMIAVASANGGFFDYPQALMIASGTLAGSMVTTYALSFGFRGSSRQVIIGQILFNLACTLLLLAYAIVVSVDPGQSADTFGLRAGDRTALGILSLNVVLPALLSLVIGPYQRLCTSLAPHEAHEELGRPSYLNDEILDSPDTALLLGEREQLRLWQRLPQYLEAARDTGVPAPIDRRRHHEAFREVTERIHEFHGALLSRTLSAADTELLLNQQNRQELLNGVEEVCSLLWSLQEEIGAEATQAKQLALQVIEALDLQILTAIAALEQRDSDEIDTLLQMTADRGATMEAVRKRFFLANEQLAPELRTQVLRITTLFERASWSVGRFARLLSQTFETAGSHDVRGSAHDSRDVAGDSAALPAVAPEARQPARR